MSQDLLQLGKNPMLIIEATIGGAVLAPIVLASGVAGVASGLVASCVAGGMLSSAAEKLSVAEQRLDEKRQAHREFELRMACLEGQLESLGNSKNRLVSAWDLSTLVADLQGRTNRRR